MQLGELALAKKHWPALAKELESRLSGTVNDQLSIIEKRKTKKEIDFEKTLRAIADESVKGYFTSPNKVENLFESTTEKQFATVDLNSATTSYSRTLGPELVGHKAWMQLELPQILAKCGLSATERSLAEAVALGRLIEPGSDLSTWNWLIARTALVELTEAPLEKIGKHGVYSIADRLLQHKKEIEDHLLQREKVLFPDRRNLYLLDLTNFYMEGQCAENDLAFHGKSKEKRSDCPLVSLALIVDGEGFPVVSRVYEGNVGEPSTLEEILCDMGCLDENGQMELPSCRPTLVMDRGIATSDNLALIKDKRFPYVVVERGPRHKEYSDVFSNYKETFQRIGRKGQKDVWVRKVAGPDEDASRILCVSEGRQAKERAIAGGWIRRATRDLERFRTSIGKGSIKKIDKVNQRLGRIKGRYVGFDKRFAVDVVLSDDGKTATDLTFEQPKTDAIGDPAELLYGCYVMETSFTEKHAADVWHLYMTLTRVESAFRSLKTDLGTRPIYHQIANRTKGHLFISVLAYHLLINIEYRLSRHGDNRSWKTIRNVLKTHQRTTIVIL
ncbi:MAG: IS1634 family transposase, partial [Proteobacteria bacterium]|nr:IS1634 family transposase [Pseudomonadota bacterium]